MMSTTNGQGAGSSEEVEPGFQPVQGQGKPPEEVAQREGVCRQGEEEEFSTEGIAAWRLELMACPKCREQSDMVGAERVKGM